MSIRSLLLTGCTPHNYPIDVIFSILDCEDGKSYEVPKVLSMDGGWGEIPSISITDKEIKCIPKRVDILWVALAEEKVYSLEDSIDHNILYEKIEKLNKYDSPIYIIVGCGPHGLVAMWIKNKEKSYIIYTGNARVMFNQTDTFPLCKSFITVSTYCKAILNNQNKSIIANEDYEKHMQQFTYRYQPLFEKWDDGEEVKWQKYKEDELQPEFEYIEESLYDGTHDKLHDDGLLKYHEAGKPKKLAIKWHIKKSEYTAYFWFEDERICTIFERFYGAHPDTKTDFIIRIDAEKKKYELALYRQGLKEPQIISEDAYQLLVFKNKFEDYRSDNYNQERGAWIW